MNLLGSLGDHSRVGYGPMMCASGGSLSAETATYWGRANV